MLPQSLGQPPPSRVFSWQCVVGLAKVATVPRLFLRIGRGCSS